MKTTIFIKSYPGDYRWLVYLLRSIQRYVTGYHEVVVALPSGRPLPLTKERIVYVDEWPDNRKANAPTRGYYHQMFVKLCADIHCPDADAILYVDSDCVFARPFDVKELYRDGKHMILRRRWEDAGTGLIWRAPAEHALGFPARFDTMACHPSVYLADTVRHTREHIENVHRQPLERYVRSRETFIEFVTLGNYALTAEEERYHAVDYGPDDGYPRPLKQFWSHAGITPAIEAEIEALLR